MAKNGERCSKQNKLSKHSSSSLKLDTKITESQASWTRSDSFSSCSSDSMVYCSPHHVQNSNFKVDHSLIVDNLSSRLRKRKRNSSGSSICSSNSCMSDKDVEKASLVISSDISNETLKNFKSQENNLSSVSYSNFSSNKVEIKHETILNENVSCSTRSTTALPFHHNLRRNIRRKTCSCDCAARTFVYRRLEKISTKTVTVTQNIKTCTENNSAQNTSTPPRKRERKRKSEIEKLYESLHEIKWAKDFSPDNILSQINIRKAASSSKFGHSVKESQPGKHKLKNYSNITLGNNSEIRNIKTRSCRSNSKNIVNSNELTRVQKRCAISKCKKNSESSDFNVFEKTDSSSDPPTSVGSCSSSPGSFQSRSIHKETSELLHTEALYTLSTDCKEVKFSFTSDGASTDSAKPKDFLMEDVFDINFRSESISSDLISNQYSVTPNFVNIARESLHTIDICFREVGANVTISSEETDLPQLTAFDEKDTIDNFANDSPPVLEPCVNITDRVHSSSVDKNFRTVIKEEKVKRETLDQCKCTTISDTAHKNHIKSVYNFNKVHKDFVNYSANVVTNRKKNILNKYLKYSRSKRVNLCKLSEHDKGSKDVSHSVKKNFFKKCISSPDIPSILPIISLKSGIACLDDSETIKINSSNSLNTCISTYESSETKILLNFGKNSEDSIFNHKESCIESTKNEFSFGHEPISRTQISSGFSFHYKTIRVNRNIDYTQVVLKLTRGRSIYLTQEALTEVTDVIRRANIDSSCNVCIINGIGDSFCSGLDLKPLIGLEKYKAVKEIVVAIKELIEALSSFSKPLIAVVNGPAFGLGMTLLHHADFVLASETATFWMPYAYLGYFPEGGATLTLPQTIGTTLAMDLILRGRILTAQEACNTGLISKVVEGSLLPTELVSKVRELTSDSSTRLQTTKALLRKRLHLDLKTVLENEVELLPRLWLTSSCQDAIRSALNSGMLA